MVHTLKTPGSSLGALRGTLAQRVEDPNHDIATVSEPARGSPVVKGAAQGMAGGASARSLLVRSSV